MGARSLLQALWVAVIVGAVIAQNNRHQPVRFPASLVRSRARPRCAGIAADPSSPCTSDSDYNDNVKFLVNRLIQQSNSINAIVSNPILNSIFQDTLDPIPGEIGTRFGPSEASETTVCAARRERIFPKRAKTIRGDWAFVVNQENVEQALTFERCFKEGQPCELDVPTNRAISTVCRQKYVYRSLLTVGDNTLGPEKVLMPSCCVCYRKRRFDVGVRDSFAGFVDTPGQSPVALPSGQQGNAPLNSGATQQGNRGRSPVSTWQRSSSSQGIVQQHQSPVNGYYRMGGR